MEQAEFTGKRLRDMNIKFDKFYSSTMIRAIQTATIIKNNLPYETDFVMDSLLMEGAPIPPEPPVGNWRPLWHVNRVFFSSAYETTRKNTPIFIAAVS
jgi:bisphosphoglycerate-dependent phosphoglycerate mutase